MCRRTCGTDAAFFHASLLSAAVQLAKLPFVIEHSNRQFAHRACHASTFNVSRQSEFQLTLILHIFQRELLFDFHAV
jgi:hypothetical protein